MQIWRADDIAAMKGDEYLQSFFTTQVGDTEADLLFSEAAPQTLGVATVRADRWCTLEPREE